MRPMRALASDMKDRSVFTRQCRFFFRQRLRVLERTISGFIACKTDVTQLMLVKIGERPQSQSTISPLFDRRIQPNQRVHNIKDDMALSRRSDILHRMSRGKPDVVSPDKISGCSELCRHLSSPSRRPSAIRITHNVLEGGRVGVVAQNALEGPGACVEPDVGGRCKRGAFLNWITPSRRLNQSLSSPWP